MHERHEGGDPACWLDQVCADCGMFMDDEERHLCSEAPTVAHDVIDVVQEPTGQKSIRPVSAKQ